MFNFNRMFLKYSIQGFYFISKLWGQKIINIFYKKISLVEITLENQNLIYFFKNNFDHIAKIYKKRNVDSITSLHTKKKNLYFACS